ncbi:MAG TPA: CoA ester lyase, partial [Bacillota bacterium]
MYRTMLFAPADHPRRREKALALEADAVILDLEDAVAVQEKPKARAEAREFVAARGRGSPVPIYVRINDLLTPWALDDLLEVTVPGLAGVVLPKVERPEHIWTADWLLANRERDLGLETGHFHLIPILETAEGIARAYEIATASPRLKVLAFGAGDYTKDIDVRWPQDGSELLYPRLVLVNVSRRAGLFKPLDGPWPRIEDLEGMERDTLQA